MTAETFVFDYLWPVLMAGGMGFWLWIALVREP
jgi:hypothetical protein